MEEELNLFMVFGDRKDLWSVCVQLQGGPTLVWSDEGYWGGSKAQVLACEVSADHSAMTCQTSS